MLRRFLPFFLVGLIFLCNSCSQYKNVNVSGIQDLRILQLSEKGIEVEIGVKIENPNSFAFNIYRSSFDIKLNNESVGEAKLDKKVRVKAHSNDIHYFHVSADFSHLSAATVVNLLTVALKRSVPVSLKGEIKAGKFFHKEKIPIDVTQRVDIHK